MPLFWTAKCKNCGKLSTVPKPTGIRRIPGEKSELKCPHCGAVNEFGGSDVVAEFLNSYPKEVLAYVPKS
jgi:phage FluMu protein Com